MKRKTSEIRRTQCPRVSLLCLCLYFGLGISGCNSHSESGALDAENVRERFDRQAKPTVQYENKISSTLLDVIQQVQAAGITRNALQENELEGFSTPFVRVSSTGEIQVYIHLLTVDDASLETLKAHDVRIEISNSEMRIIQGWVPFDAIQSLSQLEVVEKIEAPSYGHTHNN